MRVSRSKKWVVFVLTVFILLLGSVGGYAYYKYQQLFDRIYEPLQNDEQSLSFTEPILLQNPIITIPRPAEQQNMTKDSLKPFTMLLVGTDTRGEKNSRSDSMFIAIINPEQQRVSLIPIPRDMYVQVEGHGTEKMNHTMFYGGIPLLKKTIEQTFDIPLDRYMTIDFEGFRRIVDEIGGVEINVKKRMKYTDPTDDTYIDLHKGIQILDGQNALYYARYRRSDIGRDDTDEERSARQIELIQAIIEQGKEKASAFRIFSFFEIAGDHIKTDLTRKEIEQLVMTFRHFTSEQLETTSIMGEGMRLPYGEYNLFFYVVEDEEIARIRKFIKDKLKY